MGPKCFRWRLEFGFFQWESVMNEVVLQNLLNLGLRRWPERWAVAIPPAKKVAGLIKWCFKTINPGADRHRRHSKPEPLYA